MATSTQEWIDELKSISVLELSERIKALEEEFGVSARRPPSPRRRPAAAVAATPPRKRRSRPRSTSSCSAPARRRSRSSRSSAQPPASASRRPRRSSTRPPAPSRRASRRTTPRSSRLSSRRPAPPSRSSSARACNGFRLKASAVSACLAGETCFPRGRPTWPPFVVTGRRPRVPDASCPRMNTIVLGAGPIGLAAGMMLARDGHSVTVLERDPAPVPDSPEEAWDRGTATASRSSARRTSCRRAGRHVLDGRAPGRPTSARDDGRAAARPAGADAAARSRTAPRAPTTSGS